MSNETKEYYSEQDKQNEKNNKHEQVDGATNPCEIHPLYVLDINFHLSQQQSSSRNHILAKGAERNIMYYANLLKYSAAVSEKLTTLRWK